MVSKVPSIVDEIHNDEEVMGKMNKQFQLLMEDNSLWNKVIIQKEIEIYKKMEKGNPAVFVKAKSILIDYTADEVFQQIYDPILRVKFDKVALDFKIVKVINP